LNEVIYASCSSSVSMVRVYLCYNTIFTRKKTQNNSEIMQSLTVSSTQLGEPSRLTFRILNKVSVSDRKRKDKTKKEYMEI